MKDEDTTLTGLPTVRMFHVSRAGHPSTSEDRNCGWLLRSGISESHFVIGHRGLNNLTFAPC